MQRRKASGDEAWLLSYADLITNLLIFFVMLLSAAEISRSKMQKITQNLSGQESPQSLSSIQKEIDQKIVERGMESLVSTKLTDDGLELSLNSGIVFDSGKALIRDEVTKIVSAMLATLSPYAQRYAFAVEGHTDRIPLPRAQAIARTGNSLRHVHMLSEVALKRQVFHRNGSESKDTQTQNLYHPMS